MGSLTPNIFLPHTLMSQIVDPNTRDTFWDSYHTNSIFMIFGPKWSLAKSTQTHNLISNPNILLKRVGITPCCYCLLVVGFLIHYQLFFDLVRQINKRTPENPPNKKKKCCALL